MQQVAGRKQIGNLLVEAGLITPLTLKRALERQRGTRKYLGAVLYEMGVITEQELVQPIRIVSRVKKALELVARMTC
jgi:hypothetical protein